MSAAIRSFAAARAAQMHLKAHVVSSEDSSDGEKRAKGRRGGTTVRSPAGRSPAPAPTKRPGKQQFKFPRRSMQEGDSGRRERSPSDTASTTSSRRPSGRRGKDDHDRHSIAASRAERDDDRREPLTGVRDRRLRALAHGEGIFTQRNLRRLFRMLDIDNSHEVSPAEIQRGMISLGFEACRDPTVLSRLLCEIDEDRTGTITETEFLSYFSCITKEQLTAKLKGFETDRISVRATVFGGNIVPTAGVRLPGLPAFVHPWDPATSSGAHVWELNSSRLQEALTAIMAVYNVHLGADTLAGSLSDGLSQHNPAGRVLGGGGETQRAATAAATSAARSGPKLWLDVVGHSRVGFEALCSTYGLNAEVITDALIFQAPKLDLSAGLSDESDEQVRALILLHCMSIVNPALVPEVTWADLASWAVEKGGCASCPSPATAVQSASCTPAACCGCARRQTARASGPLGPAALRRARASVAGVDAAARRVKQRKLNADQLAGGSKGSLETSPLGPPMASPTHLASPQRQAHSGSIFASLDAGREEEEDPEGLDEKYVLLAGINKNRRSNVMLPPIPGTSGADKVRPVRALKLVSKSKISSSPPDIAMEQVAIVVVNDSILISFRSPTYEEPKAGNSTAAPPVASPVNGSHAATASSLEGKSHSGTVGGSDKLGATTTVVAIAPETTVHTLSGDAAHGSHPPATPLAPMTGTREVGWVDTSAKRGARGTLPAIIRNQSSPAATATDGSGAPVTSPSFVDVGRVGVVSPVGTGSRGVLTLAGTTGTSPTLASTTVASPMGNAIPHLSAASGKRTSADGGSPGGAGSSLSSTLWAQLVSPVSGEEADHIFFHAGDMGTILASLRLRLMHARDDVAHLRRGTAKQLSVELVDAILQHNFNIRDSLKDWEETLADDVKQVPAPHHTSHLYALERVGQLYTRGLQPLQDALCPVNWEGDYNEGEDEVPVDELPVVVENEVARGEEASECEDDEATGTVVDTLGGLPIARQLLTEAHPRAGVGLIGDQHGAADALRLRLDSRITEGLSPLSTQHASESKGQHLSPMNARESNPLLHSGQQTGGTTASGGGAVLSASARRTPGPPPRAPSASATSRSNPPIMMEAIDFAPEGTEGAQQTAVTGAGVSVHVSVNTSGSSSTSPPMTSIGSGSGGGIRSSSKRGWSLAKVASYAPQDESGLGSSCNVADVSSGGELEESNTPGSGGSPPRPYVRSPPALMASHMGRSSLDGATGMSGDSGPVLDSNGHPYLVSPDASSPPLGLRTRSNSVPTFPHGSPLPGAAMPGTVSTTGVGPGISMHHHTHSHAASTTSFKSMGAVAIAVAKNTSRLGSRPGGVTYRQTLAMGSIPVGGALLDGTDAHGGAVGANSRRTTMAMPGPRVATHMGPLNALPNGTPGGQIGGPPVPAGLNLAAVSGAGMPVSAAVPRAIVIQPPTAARFFKGHILEFQELSEDIEAMCSDLDRQRAHLNSLRAELDSLQSAQMNRTLYLLTLITALAVPATFLTGLWGQNFTDMPELDPAIGGGYKTFWISISVVVAVVVTTFWKCGFFRMFA